MENSSEMERSSYQDATDNACGSFCILDAVKTDNDIIQKSKDMIEESENISGADEDSDVEVIHGHVSSEDDEFKVTEQEEFVPEPELMEEIQSGADKIIGSSAELMNLSIDSITSRMLTNATHALELAKAQGKQLKDMITNTTTAMESKTNPIKPLPKSSKVTVTVPKSPKSTILFESIGDENDVREISSVERFPRSISSSFKSFRESKNSSQSQSKRRNQKRAESDALDLKTFIINHLHNNSRYIIFASIVSFCTAFVLLSWYSAQTHSQDMEMYQLKEKEVSNQQSIYEKMQERYENFRETLIHQRYEETRDCRDTLKSCHSGNEEFLQRIAKMEEDASKEITYLTTRSHDQEVTIHALREQLEQLKEENLVLHQKLRKEAEKTASGQLFAAILTALKNKGVHIIICGFALLLILPLFVSSSTSLKL